VERECVLLPIDRGTMNTQKLSEIHYFQTECEIINTDDDDQLFTINDYCEQKEIKYSFKYCYY